MNCLIPIFIIEGGNMKPLSSTIKNFIRKRLIDHFDYYLITRLNNQMFGKYGNKFICKYLCNIEISLYELMFYYFKHKINKYNVVFHINKLVKGGGKIISN